MNITYTKILHCLAFAIALLLLACDGGGGGSTTPSSTFAPFAENMGGTSGINDAGAVARFNYPYGVATDSADNVYVADFGNHTIRKVTPDGEVSTLAGKAGLIGSADGTGEAARFSNPVDVATDSAGNVYVADFGNHTIRKITHEGVVSTLAGTAGVTGSRDGMGGVVRFNNPIGIATDSAGNVYVTDSSNSTIRKITSGGEVSTLVGTAGVFGSADGTGAAARFNTPYGVATDSLGNIYVADRNSHTIRKITPAGVVSTLAGVPTVPGSSDGIGGVARFNYPYGIATDRAGNVYVADRNNHIVRKITPAGVVSTLAGTARDSGSTDGIGAAASFDYPYGVAADRAGSVYVADRNNHTIRKITPEGVVCTLAGTVGLIGSADSGGVAER